MGKVRMADAQARKDALWWDDNFGEHRFADCYTELAIIHEALGDTEGAVSSLRTARQRLSISSPKNCECIKRMLAISARVSANGGQDANDTVAKILEQLGPLKDGWDVCGLDEHQSDLLLDLTNLYNRMGKLEESEQLLRWAINPEYVPFTFSPADVASATSQLADNQVRQGKPEEAFELLTRASELRRKELGDAHPQTADSLYALARLHVQSDNWPQALMLFDQSRRVVRRHVVRLLPALSAHQQTTFLKRRDRQRFNEVLTLATRRAGESIDTRRTICEWILNSKGTAHEASATGATLARSTQSSLQQELRRVRSQIASLTVSQPIEGGKSSGQIKNKRQRIANLQKLHDQLVAEIADVLVPDDGQDSWVTLHQVREALPEDSLFVNIFRHAPEEPATLESAAAERYIAVVVFASNDQVEVLNLGAAGEIDMAILSCREQLSAAPRQIEDIGEPAAEQQLRKALQGVSDLLLEPLAPYFEVSKHLIISPDSTLWLAPWAALPQESGEYLIQSHRLTFANSGRDLITPQHSQLTVSEPVVFADPDFDRQARKSTASNSERWLRDAATNQIDLPPTVARLPGTAAEAEAIRPLLSKLAGPPIVFLGSEAHEQAFKRVLRPALLVLSTHGYFLADEERSEEDADTLNPLLSCGLLLAGYNRRGSPADPDGNEGVLTGLEIASSDLRGTSLVVLSACDTGVGRIENGEGVAGLRHAFWLAGARSVVSTLWKVSDAETARLMQAFFENLSAGVDRSAALRQAQLSRIAARRARHGAAHPFFWAGFGLTGR